MMATNLDYILCGTHDGHHTALKCGLLRNDCLPEKTTYSCHQSAWPRSRIYPSLSVFTSDPQGLRYCSLFMPLSWPASAVSLPQHPDFRSRYVRI